MSVIFNVLLIIYDQPFYRLWQYVYLFNSFSSAASFAQTVMYSAMGATSLGETLLGAILKLLSSGSLGNAPITPRSNFFIPSASNTVSLSKRTDLIRALFALIILKRDTDTAFKRGTAVGFYKLMKGLGVDIIENHADYRLMSKHPQVVA